MITGNINQIRNNLNGSDATLIVVSKKQTDDRIDEALDLGIRIYGENRVQEAFGRWEHRRKRHTDLELHLIGPLQTNKVKQAVQLFDVIHTVDREKLAVEIYKHAPDIPCFIQVNVGNEPQKSGIAKCDIDQFYKFCTDMGMNIIGLMCIPPNDADPSVYFQWMQDKANSLNLKNLSMGMSSDYKKALQFGATYIRVGSALFGSRQID
jgi:pyridoxal phosphate enzyme (YggS family)